MQTDIRDTTHKQGKKMYEKRGKYETLSQDTSLDRLVNEQEKYFNGSQNIKSLQMSAKITQRPSSNFKSKFSHLFHKKKI